MTTPEADALLVSHRAARVAADPARAPALAHPGGWPGLAYWRLHGSPVMYRAHYAAAIAQHPAPDRWCMFDNTASSAATGDALALMDALPPR